MSSEFQIVTDTATICVFDPANLEHRLTDTIDWWSVPEDELLELNLGNVIIAALPRDGVYSVAIVEVVDDGAEHVIEANLNSKSGKIFIGAGEYISGDGMTFDIWGDDLSGKIVNVGPGNFRVSMSISNGTSISVKVVKTNHGAENTFDLPLELCD